MIDSVALRAPISPPETGASSACAFRVAAACAISMASEGSVVVMSTSTEPALVPAMIPASEK
jgi:hypothetical protein